ncbi:MAG: hypothetical protein QOH60_2498 [Mycobacterium sp.]|jgi:3-hydroxyisobutyrate dehydrogenase|nr:hypothetical protein [Mycobacterium sp.]
MRVGFIGLGSQGGPMARAIIDAGFETTLWARRPATLKPYADTEAKVAGTPAELGANSDLACVCVVGDSDVEEVLCGETGVLAGMAAGGIIAIHSTVSPDTCRIVAEAAADKGISVIDAPVSGGAPAVAERRLLVMVGGDADVVERCRPVFETYGSHVHLGDVGSGQLAKLLNNLLFTANLANAKTALDFGAALGVDPASLGEVLTRGSANSSALGSIAGSGGSLDVMRDIAGALLQKDVRLIVDIAEKTGESPGPVLDAADAALSLLGHPR